MVRKRNMNKKRSQVAHYVKCELLVARRDPWRFFCSCFRCCCCWCCVSRSSLSFIACVRCLVVYFICFTLYDVALKYVYCVIILYILCIFEIPPPNGVLFVLLGFRSFNCSVCSSFFYLSFFTRLWLLCVLRFFLSFRLFFLLLFHSISYRYYLQSRENLCSQNKFT